MPEKQGRVVYAFTKLREKAVGTIDEKNQFHPNEFFKTQRALLPSWPTDTSVLSYDPAKNALYYAVDLPGPVVTETLDFLPLELSNAEGQSVTGRFSLDYATTGDGIDPKAPVITLSHERAGEALVLARAVVPTRLPRSDVQLGSYDNQLGTYLPEAAYRAGADQRENAEPSVTFSCAGEFTDALETGSDTLVLTGAKTTADRQPPSTAAVKIDGNFADWRNIAGIDDPRGDVVPYLEYVPDVDLLEFKVSHDDEHIYLYVRVAGQVGRLHPDGGRSYFYAYMDVDRNPATGFLPYARR